MTASAACSPSSSHVTVLAVLLAIVLFSTSACETFAQAAADTASTYTSTAEQDCRSKPPARAASEDGGSRRCPGPHGLFIFVSKNDLRDTVSVGRNRLNAEKQPAASQSFGPFNSTTTTAEWRSFKGRPPYALIQRWNIADNDDVDKNGRPQNKQLLVVFRLSPGPVCHVAYVDVKANANANELARKAADGARSFNCEKDKVRVEGNSGRAVQLALPARN